MKDEVQYSVKQFSNALSQLNDGIQKTKDQLDRDGVIQRFEFTFELAWKTLKIFLLKQGIITKSPAEAFKESFKFGLIKDDEIFLDMLEDRNQTSHIYSKEMSKGIFNRIKRTYYPALQKLLKEIKKASTLKRK